MTHTIKTGESIGISFSSLMSASIMRIECNFNVYVHAGFAHSNLCGIDGVRALTGIRATGKTKGEYSFLVKKTISETEITTDVIEQFENYFIDF